MIPRERLALVIDLEEIEIEVGQIAELMFQIGLRPLAERLQTVERAIISINEKFQFLTKEK